MDKILDGLITSGYYNCQLDVTRRIADNIRKEQTHAHFPDWLGTEYPDVTSYPRILWSTLVVAYGDYGTSPRCGWIEKIQQCVDALDEVLRQFDEEVD